MSRRYHSKINIMEESEEEEEIIVYANFEEGTVEKEVFQLANFKLKMIGLDSDMPIVQLRDSTFKGEWNDTIGTKLLFEEDPSPDQVDPTFTITPEIMLKYKCQSTKTLNLSRIFLKPKGGAKLPDSEEPEKNDAAIKDDGSDTETLNNALEKAVKPDSETDNFMKEIVNEALAE